NVVAFAGPDPERAVFYPRDERFLVERDLTVRHYDVYGGRGLAGAGGAPPRGPSAAAPPAAARPPPRRRDKGRPRGGPPARGVGAGEEGRGVRDVLRLPDPAYRDGLRRDALMLLEVPAEPPGGGACHVADDEAGGDRVGGDAVGAELQGERLGEADHAGLRAG